MVGHRPLLAAVLAVGVAWAAQLGAPIVVRACSCVPPPETLAAYRDDANIVVLSGTVVALDGQKGMFGIEQVFKGPVTGAAMPIEGGDGAMCGISLKLGLRLVMASWLEGGVLRPNSCMLWGSLPSPEGDALLADAQVSYGGGIPPPGGQPQPTEPPVTPAPIARDHALPVILGGVLAAVVLLFAAIALLSRRARKAP